MALITAAQAREYLQGLTGTTEDTTLDTFIGRAGESIALYLGYEAADSGGSATLETDTYTEFLPGPGGRSLQLPYYPLQSVATIEDDSQEVFDGSTELVPAGDYVLRDNRGIVLLKVNATHTWSRTRNEVIKAVWVGGWASIPLAIEEACGLLVAFRMRQRATFGNIRLTADGAVAEAKERESMPIAVRDLLDPFKLLNAVYP